MESEFFKIFWELVRIVGIFILWWCFFDLVYQLREYLKHKNYEARNKTVCDVCFKELQKLLKHIEGK